MIRVRDRSTAMASDSVRLMKLLRSLYSVREILGLGLQFDPNIHVNPEGKFRGTKWRSAEQSETGFGRGVRGPSPGNFQKPVLQVVQSDVFLSYICESN